MKQIPHWSVLNHLVQMTMKKTHEKFSKKFQNKVFNRYTKWHQWLHCLYRRYISPKWPKFYGIIDYPTLNCTLFASGTPPYLTQGVWRKCRATSNRQIDSITIKFNRFKCISNILNHEFVIFVKNTNGKTTHFDEKCVVFNEPLGK